MTILRRRPAGWALSVLISMSLAGCGATESNDTSQASAEIQQASSQGGATPNPNLPKPMVAGGGGAAQKTGKFRAAGPGG